MGCAGIAVLFAMPLEPTEFSGGSATGTLLSVHNASIYLFIVAAAFVIVAPRVASVLSVVAIVLALPLYLFFLTPGVFRLLFRHDWSVPSRGFFQWNTEAVVAIAASLGAGYVQLQHACARKPTIAASR